MSCELSPSASAFSSMLSAFIGSILNGLFNGFWIAFFTGWISWLAFIRILSAGLFEFYLTIRAGTNFNAANDDQYQNIDMNSINSTGSQTTGASAENRSTGAEDEEARLTQPMDPAQAHFAANDPTMFPKPPERTVTAFGWLGWAWSALYTPVSQSIWLSVNFTSDNGALQLVRALAIAVSALGLTFDYKQRYAASLGRRWGAWAFVTFNAWNSAACLLLGVEATILLIHGALHIDMKPIPLLVAYPIFAIIWATASWKFLPPIDGARPGMNIFADVLMGAFAGLFVAGPAFGLWKSEEFNNLVREKAGHMGMGYGTPGSGTSLGDFLSCESASFWEKFAAIMP
ncbi:hypothetical protein K458DRAFT_373734 [Lentithecium fluviatile CBS 122367]|uniref:Uncharacterized protein n=1 Tax=Lentithecium fluviatile CBS 122367 TaxID=1168545 RepID=A0A6G1IQJ5_9PLEO|nr:hypothetical protein K458DRAFT_373734 [Lentithecium fluviatile CBS 122367]